MILPPPTSTLFPYTTLFRSQKLIEKVEETKKKWRTKQEKADDKVTAEDIASVVSIWTGVPVSRLTKTESERLLNMEEVLHEHIIGQEEAVTAISKERSEERRVGNECKSRWR